MSKAFIKLLLKFVGLVNFLFANVGNTRGLPTTDWTDYTHDLHAGYAISTYINVNNLFYLIPGLCEVENGESNIIVDINESRGNGECGFYNLNNVINSVNN